MSTETQTCHMLTVSDLFLHVTSATEDCPISFKSYCTEWTPQHITTNDTKQQAVTLHTSRVRK